VSDLTWNDLADPTGDQLQSVLPGDLHPIADNRLRLIRGFSDEVFPRLESHDSYLFGELAYPMYDAVVDEVGTVGIRVIIDFDRFISVTQTPTDWPSGIPMPDLSTVVGQANSRQLLSGDCIWLLLEFITPQIDRLVDDAHERTNELEYLLNHDHEPPSDCRQQIARLRNIYLQLESIITPTLSVAEKIIDDRLDLKKTVDGGKIEIFPRSTEIYLIDVAERLRHARSRTQYGRDMMKVLTDNLSSFLERKQAQAGNRLGAIASIMLLPTFVVGLYGMNIDPEYFPEFGWLNGYLVAWLMIMAITVVQITFFRRKGWL
jgi:magnesium transporter